MKLKLFLLLYSIGILKLFKAFYFHYEVKKYIKTGDVVIDIGANQGIYTRIFSSCGAFVYAVEPIGKFWDTLQKIKNVELLPVALGNKRGAVYLEQWRNTSGAYRIAKKGEHAAIMSKGSQIFCEGKINFIKIDVEGSELPIIEDMAELILKHHPVILIETGQIDRVLKSLPKYKIIEVVNNDYLLRYKENSIKENKIIMEIVNNI